MKNSQKHLFFLGGLGLPVTLPSQGLPGQEKEKALGGEETKHNWLWAWKPGRPWEALNFAEGQGR